MIPIGDSTRRASFPWVMWLLVLANIAIFAYELSLGRSLSRWIQAVGLIPVEALTGRDIPPPALGPLPLTFVTSMFVHGGFLHLGSNMLYLWVFGDNVEDSLGHLMFVVFYGACGIAAGWAHVLVNADSVIPSVGASGAIAGVLGAYLCYFPGARVRALVFLGPFITVTRIPAVIVIGIWFGTQLLSGLVSLEVETSQTSGVAFWAHIGGFGAGVVLGLFMKPFARGRRWRP